MSDLGKTNYVKAASQSHPSFLEADDVRGMGFHQCSDYFVIYIFYLGFLFCF